MPRNQRTSSGKGITKNDRREIGKMLLFMQLVGEGIPDWQAYAQVYGEVVYEAKDE